MRSARLLIPLLVAATVLVDLVVLSVLLYDEGFPRYWPHPAALLLYSLPLSQVSLVALWTGFGGKSLPWRVMGLVVTIVSWSSVFGIVGEAGEPLWSAETFRSVFSVLFLGQTVAILVLLWIARIRGLKLVPVADAVDAMEQTVHQRALFQYSLRDLLSWTTAIAVVLGLLQFGVANHAILSVLTDEWWLTVASFLPRAALALVALWAVLGTRRPWVRVLVAVLTTLAATVAENALAFDHPFDAAAFCLLQLFWLVASLWVVRIAGYRVVRQARAAPVGAPVSQEAE